MMNSQLQVIPPDEPDIHKKKSFNIISLFSGCGGLDLGFVMSDDKFQIILANDIDYQACETYALNFNVRKLRNPIGDLGNEEWVYCGDVAHLTFKNVKREVDVVLGGVPCKDFSILRGDDTQNRKGITVKRGQLYLEFIRSLAELRPKVFVMENVEGLTSANDGLAYDQILHDFRHLAESWDELEIGIKKPKKLKYSVVFSDVINFARYGVPQNRKRLIVIGIRSDLIDNKESFYSIKRVVSKILKAKDLLFSRYPMTPIEVFEGDILPKLNKEYKEVVEKYEDIFDDIDDLSNRQRDYYQKSWKDLTFRPKTDYGKLHDIKVGKDISAWMGSKSSWQVAMLQHAELLEDLDYFGSPIDETSFGDGSQVRLSEKTKTMKRMQLIPPYENIKFVKEDDLSIKHGLMSGYWRRIHPLIPSPTIIGSGGGGTWGYHYERKKYRLTTRERARLQTFPDWFHFCGSHTDARSQIGNAVPPLAGKYIGKSVKMILSTISP